jgi:hypothetical protein
MAHSDMNRVAWLFLAERYLPDADLDRLRATVTAPQGTPDVGASRVRHRESIWIPGDETLISSFEASSTEALERALLISGSPADRIVRAVRITGHARSRRQRKE